MNGLKDFTKAQAKRWVKQELDKVQNADQAARRITSEKAMMDFVATAKDIPSMPNSEQAHRDLIKAIQEKFGI